MPEIDDKIRAILQRNINGWSFLCGALSKHNNPETKFLMDICGVAIRENKKVLDEMDGLVFEPIDGIEEAQEEIQEFADFTEFEKQSIDECRKIYNTQPKLTFLQKLLGQKGEKDVSEG